MHYSLGFLKVTLGLLGLFAVWRGGVLSISSLPGPQPLGFYACVLVCESECTLSQEDRAFIHSTLKVCRWSAAVALSLGLGLSPSLTCSLSHLSDWDVSMRNKQPRLWPFDRQTVGNKTSTNREKWRRERSNSKWCPRRVNWTAGTASLRIVQRWAKWPCMDKQRRPVWCLTEDIVMGKKTEKSTAWDQKEKLREIAKKKCVRFDLLVDPQIMAAPSICIVFHIAVIDWGRQLVIHEHHRRSIQLLVSVFSKRQFYSLVKWDRTLPSRSCLTIFLLDRQLIDVRMPSKGTKREDTEVLSRTFLHTLLFVFATPKQRHKGLTSYGHIFISCSGLFILVGGVYVELSFCVYYTANDRSGSLTPLASFK